MKLVLNPNAYEILQNSNYADVLTVKEAQEILGICRISIYHLIQSNQLNAFRIGRVYMIPKQSIDQFLKNRRGGAEEL